MYQYKNGNFTVSIFEDGTKVRYTDDDEFVPSFSECCDVKITDKCGQGCKFCYEGCTINGSHADLAKYDRLIESLHPYTEFALNGNDLDIPGFEDFLSKLKNQKVFANITVNQNQFMKKYEYIRYLQTAGLISGIGVSLINSEDPVFIEMIKTMKNTVIHVINGIFSEKDFDNLKDKGLKVLFLGYKKLRRGDDFYAKEYKSIEEKIEWLREHIMTFPEHFTVISFDNLSIKQLDIKNNLSDKEWDEFYMGDDGGFTFYIDLVAGTFSKNSLSMDRYEIGDKNIDEMFNQIKSSK